MKSIRINIVGKKFGRLIVLSYSYTDENKRACWNCVCICKKRIIVSGKSLRSKNTQSCGCFNIDRTKETNTIHGGRYEHLYGIWSGINIRCKNKKNKAYKNYGGRGIKVQWKNYLDFKNDMEYSYNQHKKKFKNDTELERKNNNGDYSKENCRWATRKEQQNNKRTNHVITFNGKTQNLKQWAEELGIEYNRLLMRIWRGMPIEKALINIKYS